MKFLRKHVILAAALLLFAAFFFVLPRIFYAQRLEKLKGLRPGASPDEIVALLGPPDSRNHGAWRYDNLLPWGCYIFQGFDRWDDMLIIFDDHGNFEDGYMSPP